jgi:hypothetical protein
MTALARGTCTRCRADVAPRRGGLVREHRLEATGRVCAGSGELAAPSSRPSAKRARRGP